MKTEYFKYDFTFSSAIDVGRQRSSNQDEVVICPEQGFFAVSDGMGGLLHGGDTSDMIRQALPVMINEALSDLGKSISTDEAVKLLKEQVRRLSDKFYDANNSDARNDFGATLSGVWLIDEYAVFINLGDSRGYLLPRREKCLLQVTKDHNLAALLIQLDEMTKEEAINHPTSSQLTRFMGMPSPAEPDAFVKKIKSGDRLLLCSDGLYGMVTEKQLIRLLRSSRRNGDKVCQNMVNAANGAGGRDNISIVYLKVG